VFDAFAVKVAPDGSGAAVNVVMGSPSGSAAWTVNDKSWFSHVDSVAGAVTTGARSTICVLMVVWAEPVRPLPPDVALNVTTNVPTWLNPGIHENVPDVLATFVVNVAPAGSDEAVSEEMALPSGTLAKTVNVIRVPGSPEAVAGAVTTGVPQALSTVMLVVADPVNAFDAVKVAEYEPAFWKVGVQLNVPDVFVALATKVPPAVMAVPDAVKELMASPSGSTADTVKARREPSQTDSVAGAVTCGGRSHIEPCKTVIAVVADPLKEFEAVKVAA
jgi:hypothetical protein